MSPFNVLSALATAAVFATASSSADATQGAAGAKDECFADVIARSTHGSHGLGRHVGFDRRDALHAELTRPVSGHLLEAASRKDALWSDTAWSQREWAAPPMQWSQLMQVINALEGLWANIGQIVITPNQVDVVFRFDRPVTPVPEASTTALMLAGLGVLGWAATRRAVGRRGAAAR